MKQFYLIIICLILISGCATVGTQINDANLAKIKEGVTTQEEVIASMGKPYMQTLTSDGKIIMTASKDNTVKLCNLVGKLLNIFKGGNRWCSHAKAAFSHDGKNIIIESDIIKLCDLNGNLIHSFQDQWDKSYKSAVLSRDSKILVANICNNANANLWNLQTLREIEEFLMGEPSTKRKSMTLQQAFLLDALYEIIICQRLLTKRGEETPPYLDFNKYQHLWQAYTDLPKPIQDTLDPYIIK